MSKPSFVGKNFSLFVEPKGGGEFVEIGPLSITRRSIACSPVPGRHGVEYLPDWYGITKHG